MDKQLKYDPQFLKIKQNIELVLCQLYKFLRYYHELKTCQTRGTQDFSNSKNKFCNLDS